MTNSERRKLILALCCTGCSLVELFTRDEETWASVVAVLGYSAVAVCGWLLTVESVERLQLAAKISAKSLNGSAGNARDNFYNQMHNP